MELKNMKKNKTENNKQYVYRVLKENIMNLHLEPGMSINENEISEILNVSRTPVREAFVRLSQDKLIQVFPQKGSIVSKINLELVEEAIFLRELSEKKLFQMVCEDDNSGPLISELEKNIAYQKIATDFDNDLYTFFKLDNEFHNLIFKYYNKNNVWKSIKQLCTHYDRLRLLDSIEGINFGKIIEQHSEIVTFFKEKNCKDLDEFLFKHLHNYKKNINTFVRKHPSFFE